MTNNNSRSRNKVTLLWVSPIREDTSHLQQIITHTNWTLFCASTYEDAEAILRIEEIAVVIAEAVLPGQKTWRDFIECSNTAGRPKVIVATRSHNDSLWADVLGEGGYDVLLKPFDRLEVVRLVSLAWLNWRDEQPEGNAGRLRAPRQSGGPRSPVKIPTQEPRDRAA